MLVLEAAAEANPGGPAAQLAASKAPDVYVVNRGERAEDIALGLARRLRAAGLTVELDGSGSAFGKQFKRADRCRALWALVIGDDEAKSGMVRIKSLQRDAAETSWELSEVSAIVNHLFCR